MNLELALQHLSAHQTQIRQDLEDLIRIPSVSFPNFPLEPLEASAQKVAELMQKAGLENVQLLDVPGAPSSVYGDWLHAPGAPTVLLYAHHDVQPSMREELWQSPAFEPTEHSGRLFARGSADDKAGVLVHLSSIAAWLQSQSKLPLNVRVWIDGEEEVGSPHLEQTLDLYPDLFKADAVIIADLSNFDVGIPSLTTSLRGHVTLEVELKSMQGPLHSGIWSGALPDPVAHLCRILGSLTDANNLISVPELLQGIQFPSLAEEEDWEKLPFDQERYREQSGILPQIPLPAHTAEILGRNWRMPTLSITCLKAGEKGQTGNVILESAWARLGLRIAPGQDAHKMGQILQKHLLGLCPRGMEMRVDLDHPAQAWLSEGNHPYQKAALEAMEESWNSKAFAIGCGATIPLVQVFETKLDQPVMLLTGIEDPECKAHAENESLHLGDFYKSIESQLRLFAKIADS